MASRSASAARSHDPATYFRRTRPFVVLVIVGWMLYYGCAVLAPSRIPYDGLGPLGKFTQYLQENHKPVFHVGKKGITDSKTQLRWFIQTLVCGIFSLYFLLVYKPPKKTQ
ncbi:transmembrane protein 254-like isoform X2 [Pantherophis guttatus]|uniref:Transmembrane protein 254 n=1 Tax=Pantherophis guttatus TaxID=94885 RepID=A0ABM3ZMU3_PANGU|nr:transmembrane protein 254-like isoform X2 [Pantherophis guttatus]